MSNAKGRPTVLACTIALALAVPVSQAYVGAMGPPAPKDKWNTFTADLTIRRGARDSSRPSSDAGSSSLKYRLVRALSGTSWKTTMAVVGGTRPEVVTPTGESMGIPPTVARIEDDGDGSAPRFYNLQGALLRMPTKSDRQKMGARESVFAATDALAVPSLSVGKNDLRSADARQGWIEALMPSVEQKSARRAALQKRFGGAVGKVRGLGRYVQVVSDETTEVLADEDLGVPVEVNTVRGGVLQSHATFEYAAGPRGSLLRRRAHSEQIITGRPERKDARLILDVELANVTLEDRR